MANEGSVGARVRWVSGIVLLLVFAMGAGFGAGLVRLVGQRPMLPPPFEASFRGLDLSDEQRSKIRDIEARYRPELEAIVRGIFPRMREVTDKIDAEARTVMTESQQRKFDQLREERPPPPH